MSTCKIIEDNENLTTDAAPDPPRENIDEPLVNEESEDKNDENIKTSLRYPVNFKKKPSTNGTSTKPKKKSSNSSSKTTHASTKVINVLNSSGIHIGAVNNYNLFPNSNKPKTNPQKENIVRTTAVDRILFSEELVKNEHIDLVSTHLGEGWREVGEHLGYSKGQMDHFYVDNKINGHKEVIYQMLLDWIQVNADDSKVRVLATALWDADQKDVVCRWSKTF